MVYNINIVTYITKVRTYIRDLFYIRLINFKIINDCIIYALLYIYYIQKNLYICTFYVNDFLNDLL